MKLFANFSQTRSKNGEILITFTDKDGRIVICPPNLYKEAANVHLQKDEKVSWDLLKKTEVLMNRTAIQVAKIFQIGQNGSKSQRDRIGKACQTKDVRWTRDSNDEKEPWVQLADTERKRTMEA